MSLAAVDGSPTGTLRLFREASLGPPSSDRAYRHYSGRSTPVHLPVSAQSLLSPKPLSKPQIPRRRFRTQPLTLDSERQLSTPTRRRPHHAHVQAQPHPSTAHSHPPWRIHRHSRSPAAASSWSCWVRPQSERYGVVCLPPQVPAPSSPPPQSSLVMRFVNNDFQENKEPTIGGTLLPPPLPLFRN